ncbi:MAG: hypothetical protein U1F66_13165 [bacterium]
MAFAYYRRLNPAQKKIYRRSDAIHSLEIPQPERFAKILAYLEKALALGNQARTQEGAQVLVSAFCRVFGVPPAKVKVLERRPSHSWGELHGLYEQRRTGPPTITVWMRTAKRIQVVAFKTFLRTILHEVMHHLDYTLLKLGDSFHTEGFYQRESSLLRQLLGEGLSAGPAARKPGRSPALG